MRLPIDDPELPELDELRGHARKGRMTIVYPARDEEHNNAVVVAELLLDG